MLETLDQVIATNTYVTNLYNDFNFTNDVLTEEEPELRERIDIYFVEFEDAEFLKSEYAETIANAVTDAEFNEFDDNQVTKTTTADDANN